MYKVEKIIHIFGLRKKVESKNSLLPRNEVVNFPHYKNFLYPVQRDKTMSGFYDLVFPFRTLFSPVFNVASAFLFDINVVTRNFLWGRGEGGLAPARLSKEVTRNDKLTQKAEAHTKSSVKSSNTLTYHQARFFLNSKKTLHYSYYKVDGERVVGGGGIAGGRGINSDEGDKKLIIIKMYSKTFQN